MDTFLAFVSMEETLTAYCRHLWHVPKAHMEEWRVGCISTELNVTLLCSGWRMLRRRKCWRA